MTKIYLAVPFVALAACTTPDVTREVTAFSSAVDMVAKKIGPDLDRKAASDRQRLDDEAIANGQLYYKPSPDCRQMKTGLLIARDSGHVELSDCRLVEIRTAPEVRTADQERARTLEDLKGYALRLGVLAKAKTVAGIKTAAGVALQEAGALAKTVPSPGGAAIAGFLAANGDGLAGATEFVARQYQYRQLRRVVVEADPRVTQAARVLGATYWNDPTNTLRQARDRLIALDGPAGAGSPASVRRLKADAKNFENAKRDDPQMALAMIAETHTKLKNRLQDPASTEDIQALLADVVALSELAKNL